MQGSNYAREDNAGHPSLSAKCAHDKTELHVCCGNRDLEFCGGSVCAAANLAGASGAHAGAMHTGGGADIVARALSLKLAERSTSIIVENRPSGTGVVAAAGDACGTHVLFRSAPTAIAV